MPSRDGPQGPLDESVVPCRFSEIVHLPLSSTYIPRIEAIRDGTTVVMAVMALAARVRLANPIRANRAEHVELERILERFSLVIDPRRDVDDLTFPDNDLFTRN